MASRLGWAAGAAAGPAGTPIRRSRTRTASRRRRARRRGAGRACRPSPVPGRPRLGDRVLHAEPGGDVAGHDGVGVAGEPWVRARDGTLAAAGRPRRACYPSSGQPDSPADPPRPAADRPRPAPRRPPRSAGACVPHAAGERRAPGSTRRRAGPHPQLTVAGEGGDAAERGHGADREPGVEEAPARAGSWSPSRGNRGPRRPGRRPPRRPATSAR